MLQEYSISDIFPTFARKIPFHVDSLEGIDRSHLVWPHKYDFYSIIWYLDGHGFKEVDLNEYLIFPNRLFLASPEQIHSRACYADAKGYVLIFDKVIAAQTGIDFSMPYVDVCASNVPLLKLVIENLINKELETNFETETNFEIDLQYLYSLIKNEDNNVSFNQKEINTIFKEFKELVLTNNTKITSVSQYADTLNVLPASLNEICQNFAGCSAKQFMLTLKMVEAKRLLVYSDLNISDIAYQLGFEEASYFARIFKKKTSLSPSAFLEKYRR